MGVDDKAADRRSFSTHLKTHPTGERGARMVKPGRGEGRFLTADKSQINVRGVVVSLRLVPGQHEHSVPTQGDDV